MDKEQSLIKSITSGKNVNKIFLGVIVGAVVLGAGSGFYLASSNKPSVTSTITDSVNQTPKNAQQDNQTFRDFAEGTIKKKPESKNSDEYSEGTHLLVRDGAQSVALTSSVVDLSQYEGKKVKVFGETQKAVKEGWLMDVGKVETE
jgi:hypothetical protein